MAKQSLKGLFLMILILGLSAFSLFGNLDSLEHWRLMAVQEIKNQDFNEVPKWLEKLRSLSDDKSIGDRATAFADLYEADYLKRRNVDRAVQLAKSSVEYFKKTDEYRQTIHAMNVRGACLMNQGKFLESADSYLEAYDYGNLHSSKDEKLPGSILRTTYSLGFVYVKYGDLTKASQFLATTLENAISLKDTMIWAHTLNMIGNVHIRRYEYQDAIDVNREALSLAQKIKAKGVAYIKSSIATSYIELNQLDSAEYHLNEVIQLRREEKNYYSLGICLNNLSEVYRKRNDCTVSNDINQEMLDMAEERSLMTIKLNALVNMCICDVRDQKYQQAYQRAKEAEKDLDKSFQFNLAADLYECASDAAAYLGKKDEALMYYKLYKSNTDSLLNEKSESIIKDLRFKYESTKKNEEIMKLKKESAISAIAYRNKLLLLSTFLLLTLLVGGGYYWYQRNRVSQIQMKKLEVEQKLLRSQMNPHFIFNAISSIQNFLFDKNDLKIALSYLSKFADLMRQTLEHSREENITLENELDSLKNYLSLQQLRYQNKFNYKIIIDPEIDPSELLVPPLIAQPFVENSIEHGQIYRVDGGLVTISFQLMKSCLRLNISDNGVGLNNTESYKVSSSKKSSLSTTITRERLKAMANSSRQKFELIIEQLTQGGTMVTIDLPKIQLS